jgi:cell division protein FtsB
MFGLFKSKVKLLKQNEELVLENALLKQEVESYKKIWELEKQTKDELLATMTREKTIKRHLFMN